MNKLQYINKDIKFHKKMLDDYLRIDSEAKVIEEIKRDLEILQQIRDELEVMELIKNGWSSMETTLKGDQIMRFQNLTINDWLELWNRLEEILLKKALEAKNEKES